MMKKIVNLIVIVTGVLLLASCDFLLQQKNDNPAAGKIPEPTESWVNDYAGIFSPEEVDDLSKIIYNLNNEKNIQILLVTTPDLGTYDISDYAQRTGEKWGVGDSQTDKGLTIIIKPKNETKGEAFVATGYGLEGDLPDVRCREIVSDKMIPKFKEGDYYGAVVNALEYIAELID